MKFVPGKPVGKRFRKSICKQVAESLAALRADDRQFDDAYVHKARGDLRRMRALLLLLRGAIGDKSFHQHSRALRDAAKALSPLRDTVALLQRIEDVSAATGLDRSAEIMSLRDALALRRESLRASLARQEFDLELAKTLSDAERQLGHQALRRHGWDAIAPGLRRCYKNARDAMQAAVRERSDLGLHDWRKRSKNLRLALDFVGAANPRLVGQLSSQAHRITDLLGEDHDLAALCKVVANHPDKAETGDLRRLKAACEDKSLELQAAAIALGQSLFRLPSRRFAGRIQSGWKSAAG